MTAQQTQRAQDLMKEINAKYKSEVVTMGSNKKHVVRYLPSGLLPFDILMPGGIPRGRMIEMYGGPSSLKSYWLLYAIATTQATGGVCALLDTEHTFDAEWAASLGVDLNSLILPKVPTGERAFDMAQMLVENGVDILGFDSIAAAQPQTANDNPLEGNTVQPGRHAALFSLGLRKLTAVNDDTAILFTNQTRTAIGVTFGNPETRPGGKAPEFYASLRIRMSQAGKLTEDARTYDGEKWTVTKRMTAQLYRAEMMKSKLSQPHGVLTFVFDLKSGRIDMPKFLIAQGLETGVITQPNNRNWTFDKVTTTGKDNFLKLVTEDPMTRWKLDCAIRKAYEIPILDTTGPKKITRPSTSGTGRIVLRRKAAN